MKTLATFGIIKGALRLDIGKKERISFVLNISLIYLFLEQLFILFNISFAPPEKQSFRRLGNVCLFGCHGNGNESLVLKSRLIFLKTFYQAFLSSPSL